jgi:hypothetical protein
MKRVFVLAHETARQNAANHILHEAPDGYRVDVLEPKKTRDQEEKYHAMFGDIARQCLYHGRKLHLNSWKRLLVEAFVHVVREDAKATGKPDPFPEEGCALPSIDGLRVVQVEVLTRDLTKAQGSLLIEYLYAFGAEHGVEWSDPKESRPQRKRQQAIERGEVDQETGEIMTEAV